MSTDPLLTPDVTGKSVPLPAGRTDAILGARARKFVEDPNKTAKVFWGAALIAFASFLLFRHWSPGWLPAMMLVTGVCVVAFLSRTIVGDRLPLWTLHVDLVVAVMLTGVAAAGGASQQANCSIVYVSVALYAALYFSPAIVLGYVGGIGATYAVALAFGPAVPTPVAAWLLIVGIVTVNSAVVSGLMSALRSSAKEDPLTGLPNRRHWDERLEEELERSRRTGQPLSVAVIDLDGFKAVNDRSGHQAGDRLLLDLAHRWKAATRGGGDFIARIGGDEFGLIAPNSDPLGMRRLAKRLGQALPEGVEFSIGSATWDGTESASDLQRRGDDAMYQRKLSHRGDKGAPDLAP